MGAPAKRIWHLLENVLAGVVHLKIRDLEVCARSSLANAVEPAMQLATRLHLDGDSCRFF